MSSSRQLAQAAPRIVSTEARSALPIPPTSSKRFKSSRDRVLDAATAVFAARGYRGASTQCIAERAGVNQATVFRIFNSKQELYLKVLERKLGEDVEPWLSGTLEATLGHERVFSQVAEHLEVLFDPTLIRLLLAGGLEQPQHLRKYLRPRLLTFYSVLGAYIQKRIQSGALRDLDPESMARALVGMVFYDCIFTELFGGRQLPGRDGGRPGRTFTNIWLHGVLKDPDRA